jgi:DNA modification methylase
MGCVMTLPTPYYNEDGIIIYHGDCRNILPLLEPVDLVLTDPPYGENTHKNHLSNVADRKPLGFLSITKDELKTMATSWCKISRGWVIFTCDWHYIEELPNLIRFGIWIKPNGAPQFTGDRPGTGWEPVAILHRPGKKSWNGGGNHAVWNFPTNSGLHPTQKPIRLFEKWITQFSSPNNTILDPFMGSGTTLVAAKQLGRKAIGIEIEEKYCQIAVDRLRQGVLGL